MKHPALVSLALVAASACEFGEATIPQSDPMIVVHAVMRPDRDRQWVLVEQTLTGSEPQDSSGGRIPGNPPQLPVTGATVTVGNSSRLDDPCGMALFSEDPGDPELVTSPGLYWGPSACPAMRPGDTLTLRVETAGGGVVTGTTEVPGAAAMSLSAGSRTVSVPGPMLVLNRDVDTLSAEVAVIAGRAVQLEVGSPDSLGRLHRPFAMFIDSTAITLPGNIPNFLLGVLGEEDSTSAEDIEPVFSAGRYYRATVALFDDRYFDYARSGNMPLSGRGFINNLSGGMGVFGSMVAASTSMKVVGNLDDEREGSYRAVGDIGGSPVDVTLEMFVAAAGEDSTSLSTFVTGAWMDGAIDSFANGRFVGQTFDFVVYRESPVQDGAVEAFLVQGQRSPAQGFTAQVFDRQLNVVGSLTVSQF